VACAPSIHPPSCGQPHTTGALVLLVILALLSGCATTTPPQPGWSQLPALPEHEGFAGAFAGVSHGTLLVAGGANFPEKKPWQGGSKAWYDTVYALEKPDGPWRIAGRLPRPLGYGVSVTHRDAVVCVGGGDSVRHSASGFRLEWKAGRLVVDELPPLSKPVANASGALLGDTLYIAGGLDTPDATHTSRSVYRIDLASPSPRWEEVESLPGSGRMLATAAEFEGAFYVLGGTELTAGEGGKPQRRYLTDAFRYEPGRGWTRVADLPHSVVAAPSPAPTDDTGFFVLGGDDGSQVTTPPDRHRGFNKTLLHYDVRADRWTIVGELPAPRVTTPCVVWHGSWIIPTGEARPGVRSPEVWRWAPRTKD
jgi:N-acetylneuraminate epimerase